MKITREIVEDISVLSRLKLSDAEASALTGELEKLLDYMDLLSGLDTTDAEPLCHVTPLRNVMRPDTVEPSLDRTALLANAPVPDDEAFLVPKTVE